MKKKDVTIDSMVKVKPITDNQKLVFNEYKNGQNLFLHGAAGTGKTFVSLYLALQEVLDHRHLTNVFTLSEVQFPLGKLDSCSCDEEDKTALFQVPYQNMVQFMFEHHPIVRSVCCMID